jgi:hypothetical protein
MTHEALHLTCTCCGETKPARTAFSTNKRHATGYTPICRECGYWLRLLAAEFGGSRNWEANRSKQRAREAAYRAEQKAARDALNEPRKAKLNLVPPAPKTIERLMCPVLVPIITVWRHA